ncbi:MAG: 2-oxoacid:acceptor oxidoreductase subunit alpha [Saprospirales bacterium]|nr:2-oxoacid:acceptor oxidoreductase subunit alpha [Saprospirales bacterium]MBK6902348.1 2-oxoacid:acceptor oxidoreductase subunit alpha [Saprospirales bacterium]
MLDDAPAITNGQEKSNVKLDHVVIRFAGDSGDGMQLTGSQFSDTSAMLGNDIATFPNYPAEIRAPEGSVYGVSGFQVHIGEVEISTPGDDVDVLVAMNPAALITNFDSVSPGKTIIVNSDEFTAKNLAKAGYTSNPLEDGSLASYHLVKAPITKLSRETVKDMGLDNSSMNRTRNMFALGMVFWMFSRPLDYTIKYLEKKFGKKPEIFQSNVKVLKAGYNFAETLELLPSAFTVMPAKMTKGTYRIIMGNTATAWGFLAAAEKSGKQLFLGSYPITPASDILHELSEHLHFGVRTFQAEDEISGICSALGAAFTGSLALTTTSGPGLALKSEAIGLAVMTELPVVVVDVQRGGPSTGLPTKTEQADLLQAMYGRNGESPVIILAPSTPANCFDYAYEASRLALEHMTPVILLSDGYIANGSAPWLIRSMKDMPPINPAPAPTGGEEWLPYLRDEDSLARRWAIPGMPGFEHRIGGLEKEDGTGNISYDPLNHEHMVKLRAEKVKRVENYIPELEIDGAQSGDLLVIGWGGTFGSLHTAIKYMHEEGHSIGLAHFHYLNPMPKNTAEVLSRFKKIVVCELNLGQFATLLKSKFPEFNYLQYNKVQGLPFTVMELNNHFRQLMGLS